ncbi:cell division protein FtsA [Helicobacter cetorum]|uniref:cell division protein FtsA n=1 Tax=Helicobacter cetorum TaxID=138563 RepID=UPI000CF18D78|nr:cell division protein FtsA [Helicobacter cetorum]
MEHKEIILGVDIGSRKVCAIVAELRDGTLRIIGTAHQDSKGIKRGRINSLSHASSVIKEVIDNAKKMAGLSTYDAPNHSSLSFEESPYSSIRKTKAIVSFSGAYAENTNSAGAASTKDNVVTIDDINRAIKNACAKASLDTNKRILHALPYRFTLDRQDVNDPLGMSGTRLEVFVHIVYTDNNNVENLEKIMIQPDVEVENMVLNSYAASIATLSNDEKEFGVACIDMGGETCNLMIYSGDSMRYNQYIPVGSHHLTTDLSHMLNTPFPHAEELKIKYGDLSESEEESTQGIQIPTTGSDGKESHVVPLNEVQRIMKERALETFRIIHMAIQDSGLQEHLGGGVVLTGGMTMMKGIKELAKAYFDGFPKTCPVRLATPSEQYNIMGMFEDLKDPRFSVAVGLILYKAGGHTNYEQDSKGIIRYHENSDCIKKPSTNPFPIPQEEPSFIGRDLSDLQAPIAPKDSKPFLANPTQKKGLFKTFLDKFSTMF